VVVVLTYGQPERVHVRPLVVSSDKKSGGFSIQVIAGALAAITAAVLGSKLGVAGTVLGAGIASVVSTVGAALYLHSLRRTTESIRARVGGAPEQGTEPRNTEPERPTRRPGWPALAAAGVLAFVLGMLAITGLEWVRGEQLSGGPGTTIGGIARSLPDSGPVLRPHTGDQPATTTEPAITPSVTSTSVPSTTSAQIPQSPPPTSSGTSPPTSTTTHTGEPTTTYQPTPSGAG
jgi:hypothetical protein